MAFADGDVRPALTTGARSTQAAAEDLVRRVFPGYSTESIGEGSLFEHEYPPDDVTYATTLPGVRLLCDRRLVRDRPSELLERLHELGAGRRIIMHGMHSVVDWLGFAVWEDGALIRSLSLSPDSGIQENIGEPFDFELPYWAGEHPVEPAPGWPDRGPYPLPFHPLELGELALRALFGFVIEGYPDPHDIDTESVPLHGFRVTDPKEQAAREANYARLREMMGSPQVFRMGPDGTMQEVTRDNL
ncbi:hypothetical protein KUTG_06620 [Kutzneria sp. 744]|nr:hypothetical protein KUTG_06620 [Kutzneria sp. 744]